MKMREQRIVYTDIARDGMLTGPNIAETSNGARTGPKVVASGVSSLDDIRAVKKLKSSGRFGHHRQAIYEGRLDLKEATMNAGDKQDIMEWDIVDFVSSMDKVAADI